jgi:hypothetical protein
MVEQEGIEQQNAVPPRVRGHHFPVMGSIFRGEVTPAESSERFRQGAFRRTINRRTINYRKDVFGTTPEQAEAFQAAETAFLTELTQLPPDAPVQLTNGKDRICESCAIGTHCNAFYGGRDEAGYLKAFSEQAHKLGFGNDISMVGSADGLPVTLTTSAQTFRTVSASFSLSPK